MITKLKIWWHKLKAKQAYQTMMNIADGYPCGIQVLEHISVSYCCARYDFNHHMDKLKKLDPTCPRDY